MSALGTGDRGPGTGRLRCVSVLRGFSAIPEYVMQTAHRSLSDMPVPSPRSPVTAFGFPVPGPLSPVPSSEGAHQ